MRRLIMFGVAGALTLALAAPATSSSAATDYFMKIDGIGGTSGGCIDCLGAQLDASGSGECAICLVGKPTGGTWDLLTTATVTRTCKVKSVSGTLEISWNDGSTSTADVSGRLRGSKLKLAGAFPSTDTLFPSDPLKVLLENFPSNPCVAASDEVIGGIKITTG